MFAFKSPSIIEYIKSKQYELPTTYIDDSLAIIVETRPIEHLEWTIRNILYHTNFRVLVYTYDDSKIKHLPVNIKKWQMFDISEYNRLLTSAEFWSMKEENILIFQSDSFILHSDISKLFKYDFIGSAWQWTTGINDKYKNGSNGGFSFRKKSKMLDIINTIEYNGINEDMYFALGLDSIPIEDKNLFCCESIFNDKCYAVHAIDKYLQEDKIKKILTQWM